MLDVHAEAHNYAIRRLEESLKPVDERLHAWGRWTREDCIKLGYPTRNAIGRIMEEGFRGAAQPPGPTEIPDHIMAVDAAVAKLRGIRQKVLAIAYLWFPNAPPQVQRRKLNMSKHRWNILLRESRLIVASILGYEI